MQARSTSIERLAGCLILQLAICLPALPLSKPAGSVSKGSASSQTASTTQVPADPAAARLVPARLQNEQGTFVLFKLQKPIGEEHYELNAAGDTADLKSSIELTDRGMKESLKASLKMSSGLDPQHFEIAGDTSRLSRVDYSVTIKDQTAEVRRKNVVSKFDLSKRFFTIAGYAPVAVQMMLIRYARMHGLREPFQTLPEGRATVELCGHDTIEVSGSRAELNHYLVSGVVWGTESIWLDENDKLVACVTVDAENDHFEAVQKGFESQLGFFVTRAATAAMSRLKDRVASALISRRGVIAITGATVVNVDGKPPLKNSVVLIKDRRIVAVGTRAQVKIPKTATVLETTGKFLIPGLWDMHAHFQQVEWGPAYLAAGVTSSRDVGNEFEFICTVRAGIDSGILPIGPRLLLAGIVDGTSPTSFGIIRADTVEQAQEVVQRYKRAGFDQIKVYGSISAEVLRALAAEAHKCGMTVTGHVPDQMDTFQAIEAGLDQINHVGYPMFAMLPNYSNFRRGVRIPRVDVESPQARTAIEFLKNHGTVVDPTLALGEIMTHSSDVPLSTFEPGAATLPPELASALSGTGVPPQQAASYSRPLFEDFMAVVRALHKAGITIVAGTDQAVPGHSLHRELELYVQAGFTPLEALQSATIVPAKVSGRERNIGSIEVGKLADIVILDADPLESISNIRRTRYVVADGAVFDSAALWRSVGFRP